MAGVRRAARTDANQAAIVQALRHIGASVELLHAVGGGCPDLLVGYQGEDGTLEAKDENQPPSKRKLRATQARWKAAWQGRPPVLVKSPQEAVDIVMKWGVNE